MGMAISNDPGRPFNLVAVGMAAAGLFLIFYVGTVAGSVDWQTMQRPSAGDAAVMLVWLAPVVVSALPLLFRRVRVVRILRISATVLLWLLSAATFSVFFLPAAIFMLLAAVRSPAPAQPGAPPP